MRENRKSVNLRFCTLEGLINPSFSLLGANLRPNPLFAFVRLELFNIAFFRVCVCCIFENICFRPLPLAKI
jgi:hypothetical protein